MTLSIRHAEVESLARDMAAEERTTITEVMLSALRERKRMRAHQETPSETADRILRRRGLVRQPGSHLPVPQSAYHDLDHDLIGEDD